MLPATKYIRLRGHFFELDRIISVNKVSTKTFWGTETGYHNLIVSYHGNGYTYVGYSNHNIQWEERQTIVKYILEYYGENFCNRDLEILENIIEKNKKQDLKWNAYIRNIEEARE
jgi:hypothetical protein